MRNTKKRIENFERYIKVIEFEIEGIKVDFYRQHPAHNTWSEETNKLYDSLTKPLWAARDEMNKVIQVLKGELLK